MKKTCPLIEMGVSPANDGWGFGDLANKEVIDTCLNCPLPECVWDNGLKITKVKSDKATAQVYQCLSCKTVETLYFEDGELETVKEVVPREYRGSRKLKTRPAGKYVQGGGEILHRHENGLHLCQEIKRGE